MCLPCAAARWIILFGSLLDEENGRTAVAPTVVAALPPRYRDVSPSSTVGNIGAARRMRHTAAAENEMTTARDRSADAGEAMPYLCRRASTLLSTSAPYRTGRLVSIKILTGRFQSRTNEIRSSRVSKPVSPWLPSA